ncbi:helix-turn-helix domain-containing protein [Chryseobacterium sp. SIMBA_029]|uniref:helix-turn-helix domain-containing protein n=1 Tax=Chryseobacterium sp. SIMBA_029 TaxID=3085772 RepID=UPI00397C9611
MDNQVQELNRPNYKKIYQDIIMKKFPDKISVCSSILNHEEFSVFHILELDRLLFGMNKEAEIFNQKHRAYDQQEIRKILEFQKKNVLSNTQVASHFKLSRNTVAKWKKMINKR